MKINNRLSEWILICLHLGVLLAPKSAQSYAIFPIHPSRQKAGHSIDEPPNRILSHNNDGRKSLHRANVLRELRAGATGEDTTAPQETVLSEAEDKVYAVLQDIHLHQKQPSPPFTFRVVVVGNGAILESTSVLGPQLSMAKSPASGKTIVTFASEDASFEFHLFPGDVSKIVFATKQSPMDTSRTMRIIRMLNDTGKPICSLIVSPASDEAAASAWFDMMIGKYGEELQL